MNPTYTDDPAGRRAIQALRAAGARVCEVNDLFYCEVRSTLRAMGVSRKAGLRRIVDSGAPLYQRFSLRNGAGVFVTDPGSLGSWRCLTGHPRGRKRSSAACNTSTAGSFGTCPGHPWR
jgi:hypothetical protein